MNNYLCLGRLVSDPEVKELESGKKVCNITIAIPRSYQNSKGEYESDFVDCILWNGVAENLKKFCKKGDMVAVKGRLETNIYEKENGEKAKKTNVVVEKISFVSSKLKEFDQEPELD